MATTKGKKPKSASRHITSENFVESCGAILFNLTDPQNLSVCLIRTKVHKEWLLAKGRRNYGESRNEAAIREVTEETGFRCSLFPVTMQTRATPPDAAALIADKARVFENLTEPFTCEIREYKNPKRTKIIWWYIAALDPSNEELEKLPGEADYEPHFLPVAEAITTLTYQADRKLVERAAQLVSETLNPLDRKELTNDDASNESTEKNQQNGGLTTANQQPTGRRKGIKRRLPSAQQLGSQPQGSVGSKRKPKNGTKEEMLAFKKSKRNRMKAKRAARDSEKDKPAIKVDDQAGEE